MGTPWEPSLPVEIFTAPSMYLPSFHLTLSLPPKWKAWMSGSWGLEFQSTWPSWESNSGTNLWSLPWPSPSTKWKKISHRHLGKVLLLIPQWTESGVEKIYQNSREKWLIRTRVFVLSWLSSVRHCWNDRYMKYNYFLWMLWFRSYFNYFPQISKRCLTFQIGNTIFLIFM